MWDGNLVRGKADTVKNPVVHFEVVGRDAEALQSFYHQAFGWEWDHVMEGYSVIHAGTDGGIDGGIGGDPSGGAGRVTFYVQVEDLEGTLAAIKELGGRTVMEPSDVPNGPRLALFEDPEGHVIGLVKADTVER